ncbi:5-methylthioadenosine/S-adenosylhomocysteine deaminase [Bacteroidia bacterium]|nr:5-methylthioadenosine/S-adenosylhomocysteine deaminase [Bacteroidia bacterium]
MRKISAHYIFPIAQAPLRNAVITLADDGTITDISTDQPNVQEMEGVEFYNGIVAPAFVNAHCHLELSYMRGKIEQGIGVSEFVQNVAYQRRQARAKRVVHAAEFADALLYESGIAAVGDIANDDSCFEVKKNSSVFYHTFIEKFGLLPRGADLALQQTNLVLQGGAHVGAGGAHVGAPVRDLPREGGADVGAGGAHVGAPVQDLPREGGAHVGALVRGLVRGIRELVRAAEGFNIRASVTPHAPYSVSPQVLQGLMSLVNPQDMVSIHHLESFAEQQLFETGWGALASLFLAMGLTLPPANGEHSLRYLSQYIARDVQLLLIHNLYITQRHYDFAASHWDNLFWVLCPCSNWYIERALPPVEMLRKNGAVIALGTDSWASHPSLLLQDDLIVLHHKFPHIPLHELLTWATLNGAKALKINHLYGSLEPGKAPGLVWIQGADLSSLRLTTATTVRRLL